MSVMKNEVAPQQATPHNEVVGRCGEQGMGPFMILRFAHADGRFGPGDFFCNGCPAAHKLGGFLTSFLPGRTFEESSRLSAEDLILLVGGVPEGKEDYADIAIQALKNALDQLASINQFRQPETTNAS